MEEKHYNGCMVIGLRQVEIPFNETLFVEKQNLKVTEMDPSWNVASKDFLYMTSLFLYVPAYCICSGFKGRLSQSENCWDLSSGLPRHLIVRRLSPPPPGWVPPFERDLATGLVPELPRIGTGLELVLLYWRVSRG